MTDVLNLALKKDLFESLTSGEINVIPIEKTNWWKKRLMDVDTGRFKPFAVVSATCGSSDKYFYPIEGIELKDDVFYITITQPEENDGSDYEPEEEPVVIEPETISPEVIEPETLVTPGTEPLEPTNINPVTVNEDGTVTQKQIYVRPTINVKDIEEKLKRQIDEMLNHQTDIANNNDDVKIAVWNVLNEFCKNNDVFVVNMPNVTIRYNGQIIGCKKRLIADRDNDVRFNFKQEEFVKYTTSSNDDYVKWIENCLNKLLPGNYVFINKNACGFRKCSGDNLIFILSYIEKKRYLFRK